MIQNRVFVLGAGVGKSCGYPLASELLRELFKGHKMKEKDAKEIKNFIKISFPSFDPRFENFPNVEDVISLLDTLVELEDKEKKSEIEPTKRTLLLEICKYFYESHGDRKPINLFVKNLTEGDFVITFNWDFSLEQAILGSGKSYKYLLDGRTIVYQDKDKDRVSSVAIPILKPHGSIDWFSSKELKLKDELIFPLDETVPEEKRQIYIFKHWRLPNLSKEVEERKPLPYIIPPSIHKKLGQEAEIMKIWGQVIQVLMHATEIWFVGYSLPPIDLHAKIFIRAGLFSNENVKVKVVNPDEMVIHRYNALLGYGKFDFYPTYFTGELPE